MDYLEFEKWLREELDTEDVSVERNPMGMGIVILYSKGDKNYAFKWWENPKHIGVIFKEVVVGMLRNLPA